MITVLSAVVTVASAITAVVYVLKLLNWRFAKTPEENKESMDSSVDKEEQSFQESGRP